MGISQEQLPVRRVVFEMDDSNLVIDEPGVMKIKMQGQESYQVTGEAVEEDSSSFSDEDVKMVMDKTGKDKEGVVKALEESEGDIAEAIVGLKD